MSVAVHSPPLVPETRGLASARDHGPPDPAGAYSTHGVPGDVVRHVTVRVVAGSAVHDMCTWSGGGHSSRSSTGTTTASCPGAWIVTAPA